MNYEEETDEQNNRTNLVPQLQPMEQDTAKN